MKAEAALRKSPPTVETQCAHVLAHLETGQGLRPAEALARYGIMRLGARVWELKARGHAITSALVKTDSGKRVAEYTLVR